MRLLEELCAASGFGDADRYAGEFINAVTTEKWNVGGGVVKVEGETWNIAAAKLVEKQVEVSNVPCPHCGHKQSKVIHVKQTQVDVRLVETWRRRICTACQQRYTTLATERAMVDTHTFSFNLNFGAIYSTRVRLG